MKSGAGGIGASFPQARGRPPRNGKAPSPIVMKTPPAFPTPSVPDLPRRSFLRAGLAAAAGSALARSSAAPATPAGFSFFVVSDTHFTALETAPETLEPEVLAVNTRLVELLNRLPGTALPESMGGGKVAEPRGVLHLGDMIDSGDKGDSPLSVRRQETEWKAYKEHFGLSGRDGKLRFPLYEIHGNHDSVSRQSGLIADLMERNKKRPGIGSVSDSGLHYSWDWEGVHFIALGIVVGHNDRDLPKGRYKAYDSLQFLKKDLATQVGDSGRPVIVMHHIDLLRYSKPCGPDSERDGEWSACDVAAYHEALRGYQIAAVFHGHLHALRTDRWDGTEKSAKEGGIPVFGSRASAARGVNRGLFHCSVEGAELVIRELTCLKNATGWLPGDAAWTNEWKVPLRRGA